MIEYDVVDGVATIRINRPQRRNAFTIEMIDDWAAALDRAQGDRGVRCVLLTGAGEHFCAGVDLDELAEVEAKPLARKRLFTEHIHQVVGAVERMDRPYLAAMRGHAIGAGLDMALMCDIRFAGRSAKLSEGYVRVGLVPGDGGCYLLPRLVGLAKALELMLSGETVDAAEAHRIGLVNRVYDDEELLDRAREFAGRLAAGPPVTMQLIKRATYQSARGDLQTSLDLISSHMALVMSTEDTAEAMDAFRSRRPPVFRDR